MRYLDVRLMQPAVISGHKVTRRRWVDEARDEGRGEARPGQAGYTKEEAKPESRDIDGRNACRLACDAGNART